MQFQKLDQPTNSELNPQLNELQTEQQEQQSLVNSSDNIQQISVLQISEKDLGLNMNEFNQPNQEDLDCLLDHQQVDDQENNLSDSINIEGSGYRQSCQKQYSKPVSNDAEIEQGLIKSVESHYDNNQTPRQIGDHIMKYDIHPSSIEEKDSRITVICKYDQNEQKVKVEINDVIIYDPIKLQIYITYAKGKPTRPRPERKRKFMSKIVSPNSLKHE